MAKKTKDIRTLCYRCYSEYIRAGYKLKQLNGNRSHCDKCRKQGSQYIIK